MATYEWANDDVEIDPKDRLIQRTKSVTNTQIVTITLKDKEQRLVNLQAELVELEQEISEIKLQLNI